MNFDFSKAPKQVLDACQFGVSEHFIPMALFTGPQVFTFAMVPEDARNLRDVLNKSLELYERMYGRIPDSTKSVPSPIDLSRPFSPNPPDMRPPSKDVPPGGI